MNQEKESMDSNFVRTLVDPPEVVRILGYKWIYKKKKRADREFETYKVRLMAKGYTQ